MTEIQLSRDYKSTAYDTDLPKGELYVKSAIALTLGITPFAIVRISISAFRIFANLAVSLSDFGKGSCGVKRVAIGVLYGTAALLSITSAAIMLTAAKLFALTQKLVWGHFVEKPQGDGINTRLAQYGASGKPWQDFKEIVTVLFCSEIQTPWQLKEWARVEV